MYVNSYVLVEHSCIVSQLSAIFVPYEVQFGASGAIFGLLAVIVVELIQSWQIVDRAWWELIKIAAVTIVMFGLGTLPYVDNVAHVGGFFNGILAALIFIPYITFGKFDCVPYRDGLCENDFTNPDPDVA